MPVIATSASSSRRLPAAPLPAIFSAIDAIARASVSTSSCPVCLPIAIAARSACIAAARISLQHGQETANEICPAPRIWLTIVGSEECVEPPDALRRRARAPVPEQRCAEFRTARYVATDQVPLQDGTDVIHLQVRPVEPFKDPMPAF